MFDAYTRRWYPDYIGQRMEDDPQYIAWAQRQQPAQAPAQSMTPYIDARMLQVGSIAEAEGYQMAAGTSQMFYTKDREKLIIKEQGQNGYNLMIYDRRPPEPPKPALDPAKYVTWDGLESYIGKLINQNQQKAVE